jgi:hypothetical protein
VGSGEVHTCRVAQTDQAELLHFVPEGARVKRLEMATSKGAQSTLSRRDGFGLKRSDHEVNLISGQIITIHRVSSMKAVNGTKGIEIEMSVGVIVRLKS